MPAYMIVNITLRDPAAYEAYKAAVPPLIAKHRGEYLVRGGAHEVLEGQWQRSRLILLRFPDRATVRAFMNDPDTLPFKALRQRVADTDSVVVDGL